MAVLVMGTCETIGLIFMGQETEGTVSLGFIYSH